MASAEMAIAKKQHAIADDQRENARRAAAAQRRENAAIAADQAENARAGAKLHEKHHPESRVPEESPFAEINPDAADIAQAERRRRAAQHTSEGSYNEARHGSEESQGLIADESHP